MSDAESVPPKATQPKEPTKEPTMEPTMEPSIKEEAKEQKEKQQKEKPQKEKQQKEKQQKEKQLLTKNPDAKPEHKLQQSWTIYFDRKWSVKKGSTPQDFENNLNTLGQFDSVEGFWRLYSWMKYPSEIGGNHNVYMFKGDTKPMWEHMPHGGCWNIRLQKANAMVDRLWEELLFACISGIYDEPSVRGVVLSLRSKGDVISVWTDDSNARLRVGEQLREIANLHPSTQMEFKLFQNAVKDHSSKSHAQAYIFVHQPDMDAGTADVGDLP